MNELTGKRSYDHAVYVVVNHEDKKTRGLEYHMYIGFSEYNGYIIGKHKEEEHHVILNGFIYTMLVTEKACRMFIDNVNAADGDETDYGIAKEKCKAMEDKITRYISLGLEMPCTDMNLLTGWPCDNYKKKDEE